MFYICMFAIYMRVDMCVNFYSVIMNGGCRELDTMCVWKEDTGIAAMDCRVVYVFLCDGKAENNDNINAKFDMFFDGRMWFDPRIIILSMDRERARENAGEWGGGRGDGRAIKQRKSIRLLCIHCFVSQKETNKKQ